MIDDWWLMIDDWWLIHSNFQYLLLDCFTQEIGFCFLLVLLYKAVVAPCFFHFTVSLLKIIVSHSSSPSSCSPFVACDIITSSLLRRHSLQTWPNSPRPAFEMIVKEDSTNHGTKRNQTKLNDDQGLSPISITQSRRSDCRLNGFAWAWTNERKVYEKHE